MWIKTQQGELVNLERLLSISVVAGKFSALVMGDLDFDRSVTLGKFDTRAEADAYFNQLAHKLTGAPISFEVTGKPDDLAAIRRITLKETDHD